MVRTFDTCLAFTAVTTPVAVQVSFEADRLQVQQSRVEEAVHEQGQQTPCFLSAPSKLTIQWIFLYRVDGTVEVLVRLSCPVHVSYLRAGQVKERTMTSRHGLG